MVKAKCYSLITAILVGFAAWFTTYQSFQATERNLSQAKQKISQLETTIAAQKDSIQVLKPLHERRVKWMGRAMLSETKNPTEQFYVGTVIRNRVETCYRGHCTFKGVVLDSKQFSAFNRGRDTRRYYMSLDTRNIPTDSIARKVLRLDRENLPLGKDVLHFYSPKAVAKPPKWEHTKPTVETDVDYLRFKFKRTIN